MTSQRFHAIFDSAPRRRFLVVGDLMLDEFVWGRVSRISPEAPVPVVQVTGESYYPGGAANVARNLREFTRDVKLLGLTGDDENGERLLHLLEASGIGTELVARDPAAQTIVKTRIIARQQQVVRVDRERPAGVSAAAMQRFITGLRRAVAEVDAVLVADYGKGVVTQELADELSDLTRNHGKLLAVDPNPHNPVQWRHVSVIKPNRSEAFGALGRSADVAGHEDAVLHEVGKGLLDKWCADLLLLTLGEEGMMLFEHGRPPYHTPTRAREIFDVSGAGDTAMAILTLALTCGASPTEAAEIANTASGIVVGKLGTAAVTPQELAEAFGVHEAGAPAGTH
ncbi:MAG TPA: PfkB family carbohydrate kinase [Bryobacteraceae bacterium]|nr:PfkB family carbohydrate kinase [Bryobacteraceae bacterium]